MSSDSGRAQDGGHEGSGGGTHVELGSWSLRLSEVFVKVPANGKVEWKRGTKRAAKVPSEGVLELRLIELENDSEEKLRRRGESLVFIHRKD